MKQETKRKLCFAGGMLAAFIFWTAIVSLVDVQPIGPEGSRVGLATMNGFVHNLVGVHMELYVLTDWLGLVPVAFGMGFGILGLLQWIRRKGLLRVDYDILVLGGFYLVVLAVYMAFEVFVINYRPVLIGGFLEASYPSSTTMLVMCVMPTAMMQLNSRIRKPGIRRGVCVLIGAFVAFMVITRLISGVHWLSDILGGALLSAGLVGAYRFACNLR